jgi:hypothetical protein
MPVLWLIVLLISSITLASAADNAKTRALPLLEETGDADKKADYLESIPYRPCPSAVRMPNGQLVCLGSPGEPYTWGSHLYSEDRRSPPDTSRAQ